MARTSGDSSQVLVAGGGIGGIAAALALARRGFSVKVLEQAAQLGEIGAGIQLGPNGFAAFDALGIGEIARARAVYTDEMVMHFPQDLQWNAASIWVGPNFDPVYYPLRGGQQYIVVVTFHSRENEDWSVREGSREEV